MQKKALAIIAIFGLLATVVPFHKTAMAAPGQKVSFDGISSQTPEGDLMYIKFKTVLAMGDSEYIDVNYTISGTASGSDFYFHDGTGVARVKNSELSFPFYALDEGGLELDETVIITINSATDQNGQAVSVDQASKIHTHTIWDYNGLPKLSFLYTTDNSGENGNPGSFKVYLSRAATSNVTFQWNIADVDSVATSNATVLNGNTFSPDILAAEALIHTEVIPAGQLYIEIPLGIQDDSLFEGNENLELYLWPNPTNSVLGAVIHQTYTIIDNDIPSISFQPGASSGQESVGSVSVPVVLSKASIYNTTFSVVVDQANSTAAWGGIDWNLPVPVAAFTILAGATSANVGITVVDDNNQEVNENAIFSITNVMHNGESLTISPNGSHTYAILDNDTPTPVNGVCGSSNNTIVATVPVANLCSAGSASAVAGSGPWTWTCAGLNGGTTANCSAQKTGVTPPGGGGSGSTPSTVPNTGVCPVLNPGDMIKVAGKPAIYVVNKFSKIMYFPSGDEFKSWNEGEGYGGYITVTQDCFDNGLTVPNTPPSGINFRPGSYVIKKENSSQLYVVLPNNSIAKISAADATALYGANYKVMTIKFIFWSNYINTAADFSGKAHSGMLVRKDNKVWYVDGNNLREVPSSQMSTNRFKSAFIRTVPVSYLAGFGTGTPIDREVVESTNRTQL